ncbi:MAG TPA: hypothetical protein VEJ38_07215 [Candidatus Acidoferrales bacterium]|nr:hypothetical protein [Candidatus Acidoferrales bacterium]
MSSGFNTDVRIGDQVFHVQTEDRGPNRPVIDTSIYQNGRIVHRKTTSYDCLSLSVEVADDALRERVEAQHRSVIDELRSGALAAEIAAAAEQAARLGGIQVQLLNPQAWLSAGNVALDVAILRRADQQPQAGAQVEAAIEGALSDGQHAATSDDQGRVRIEFPLPPLGKGDLALVIRAKTDAAKDEIRFSMRSKQKQSPAGSVHGS